MVHRRSIGVGGLEISGRAKDYVRQVLDSNRLSYGPFSEGASKSCLPRFTDAGTPFFAAAARPPYIWRWPH